MDKLERWVHTKYMWENSCNVSFVELGRNLQLPSKNPLINEWTNLRVEVETSLYKSGTEMSSWKFNLYDQEPTFGVIYNNF